MSWRDNSTFCERVITTLAQTYPRAWEMLTCFFALTTENALFLLKYQKKYWRILKHLLSMVEGQISLTTNAGKPATWIELYRKYEHHFRALNEVFFMNTADDYDSSNHDD